MSEQYRHPTCPACGAPLTGLNAYCPSCGNALRELFKHPDLIQTCRTELLEMEEVVKDLPPAPGWAMLLIWFGSPLTMLLCCGLFIQGIIGWTSGILAGVILFFALTPVIAAWSQRIRRQQYLRLVRPRLVKLLQNTGASPQDLLLLAMEEKRLNGSAVIQFINSDSDFSGGRGV